MVGCSTAQHFVCVTGACREQQVTRARDAHRGDSRALKGFTAAKPHHTAPYHALWQRASAGPAQALDADRCKAGFLRMNPGLALQLGRFLWLQALKARPRAFGLWMGKPGHCGGCD